MSEYITHVAVMQDCFNIAYASGRLHNDFMYIIETERDFGEAASTTMSGDHYTVQIMEDLRERWRQRTAEDRLESKLAFVLGWISHRAADRQMKPVFRALNTPETRAAIGNECTLYNEAKIYVEYYLNREKDPYQNVMHILLNQENYTGVDMAGMQQLFDGILRNSFLRMHTMKPSLTYSVKDIEAWIDNLHSLLQKFKIDTARTASIVMAPEADKVQKYIIDSHFFEDSDTLIIAAKKLRFLSDISQEEVQEAIDAPQRSDYAIALQTALRYVFACDTFFGGAQPASWLAEQLDIGKLGRDGLNV